MSIFWLSVLTVVVTLLPWIVGFIFAAWILVPEHCFWTARYHMRKYYWWYSSELAKRGYTITFRSTNNFEFTNSRKASGDDVFRTALTAAKMRSIIHAILEDRFNDGEFNGKVREIKSRIARSQIPPAYRR